ncbi:protein phosphatase 2C domain-containing protein [Pseudolysinimonas sp.]|uniref:PP2C family protein-serine/threonine phosphatase n=1 Tax=Pseudolysinimonas sp. TaxID=2680009 RepID=UPI00286C46C6|nr:protein phosphatase 2C domain-containing protein [Pseudolysinimonas sp.]
MGAIRAYAWTLPGAAVSVEVSAASDRGHVRRINEDSYLAIPPVFLVADGMGGHSFGDRASQATARVFATRLAHDEATTVSEVLDAVREADRVVHDIGDDELAGSTLAGIALVRDHESGDPRWMVFNVGDSRVYRFDDGLEQLSVDHSAVQELLDDGTIVPGEERDHPDRNIVTRAIGAGDAEPDVWILPTGGRERFLVCSDGLTKELDDATITEVLSREDGDLSPADRLVNAALAAGGLDNVTVVVIDAVVVHQGDNDDDSSPIPARLEETLPRA